MVIDGMHGLGDNIYQRAFVREIDEPVFLSTSWPQLYADLPNVYPVKKRTRLRLQKKNADSMPAGTWNKASCVPGKKIKYRNSDSILQGMENSFGVKVKVFDLPEFERFPIHEPYAVVRPVTVRAEWRNEARNPEAEYICEAAEILHKCGYHVVTVAAIEKGLEWSDAMPCGDTRFDYGQLSFDLLMSLIQDAAVVVGGVGWIVPAALAAGVPLVCVLGGQGGMNAPERIAGEPMDLSLARWIYPDNYCRCEKKTHDCDKTITDFKNKFRSALNDC